MPRKSQYNTLNERQLHTLKLAYKFRFITAPLLAQYKGLKSRKAMHSSLERLAKQGYLGRLKTSNQGFQNKGTRYYLTTQGLNLLTDKFGIGAHIAKSFGGNRHRSERFIDTHINALRTYLQLNSHYPDEFDIYTRTEIAGQKHFPNPLPDLYLTRLNSIETKPNEYFLFDLTSKPLYEFKKDFPKLIEHLDSEVWQNKTERPYPGVLLICVDSKQEFGVSKYVVSTLDNAGIDDLKTSVMTASLSGSEDLL